MVHVQHLGARDPVTLVKLSFASFTALVSIAERLPPILLPASYGPIRPSPI